VDAARRAFIVGVPFDVVDELESEGLASPLPIFRGSGMDALVTVGMDSAMLVSLIQAPDSIRAFAAWIRDLCARRSDTIDISAKQGDRRVHLRVDGEIDINIVADFLSAAFADRDSQT
jgi:hypothetical protein